MQLRTLTAHAAVRAGRARARELDRETLEEQIRIAAIPAPTLEEDERGAFIAERFREIGLDDVRVDGVGNVLGRLPTSPAEGRPVLVGAHLDTVFGRDVDHTPRVEDERVHAPGITDNSRGLAALLAAGRIMVELRVRTRHPLVFAATVGEEGSGDLKGVKHLFGAGSGFRDAEAFVALDGSGIRRIVHRGVGSRRLRVSVQGPGGHSWSDFGAANPLHAVGSVIHRLRGIELPTSPATTLTVARAGGGTSINTIPASAWLEIDLRSESPEVLERLEAEARKQVEAAVEGVSATRRPGTAALEAAIEVIGDRPAGSLPVDAALVSAAVEATRIVGAEPELVASSTDSNVPLSLGIPAVTLGAGGESGGIHTTSEWYENKEGPLGIERALLVVLAAAGLRS